MAHPRVSSWDESYDLIVVGSGGGSIVASLIMKQADLSSIVLEKGSNFGGTTALSGGVLWIPCNSMLGDRDSPAQAREYMDAVIGNVGPASSPARRDAYIREAPRMIDFLIESGIRFQDAQVTDYYHAVHPGALERGRSLLPELFDMARIGAWADRFPDSWRSPALPVSSHEIAALTIAKCSWKGRLMAARLSWRLLKERLTGRKLRGSGRALQGGMLEIALREGLPISMETPVRELVVEDDRVIGVVAIRDGREVRIGANRGVLLNAGGFARNEEMRERHMPQPTSASWTLAGEWDTGEVLRMAIEAGAACELMGSAWWVPISMPIDSSKPHYIVVDKAGERFCNEADCYVESGYRLYARGAVPAFGIFDSQFRSRYTLVSLMLQPGASPRGHIDSGALMQAQTLDDLARQLQIDPVGLERTINRYNGFCAKGVDEDFHRGEITFNRTYADESTRPNPCMGTIARPPFYAIRIWPADVGTSGGLLTDEHARVLREDGSVIAGLYATGNTTASVMGRSDPGAGATIGPSFTFGFIAAKHAAHRANST